MAEQSKYENDFRTLEGVKQNLKDIESLEKKGLNSAISKNQLLKEKLPLEGAELSKSMAEILQKNILIEKQLSKESKNTNQRKQSRK